MDKKLILETMTPLLEKRGLFLVELSISKDNDITLAVESMEGTVTLDDCEVLNDAFTAAFDRDVEDYALTVTSAGLDCEFKVEQQYIKAVGSKVEVWLKGGRKVSGILKAVDAEKLTLDAVEHERKMINKVKYIIEF